MTPSGEEMSSKWFLLGVLIIFFAVSGCETFKGLKQDCKNTWENLKNASSSFEENWW